MTAMSRAVFTFAMSLDGFIAGLSDTPADPGGEDFMCL